MAKFNYDYLYLILMVFAMANGTILTKIIYNYKFTYFILLTVLSTVALIPLMFLSKVKIRDNLHRVYFFVVICDTIRTTLSFLILDFLPASIYTLLRMQLEMIGSAAYARTVKKKILTNLELLSLFILTVGSVLFIIPSILEEDVNFKRSIIGVLLTFVRSGAQIFGSEYETRALLEYKWDPSFLVGAQALGSSIIELTVALFIVNFTSIESWSISIWDIANSDIIIALIVSFIVIYIIHNLVSQHVQKKLSPLVRNIGKTCVPIIIWLEMLALQQEKIDNKDIIYQIAGIVIYLTGSVLYIYAKNKKKLLILILGASGVGKDTLISKLLLKHSDKFVQPKTCTTRKPRPQEHREITYFTDEEFNNKVTNCEFLSYLREPYGNYGILLKDINFNTDKIYISQDYGEQSMRKKFDVKAVYITPLEDVVDLEANKKEMEHRILLRKERENVDISDTELNLRIESSIEDLKKAIGRKDLVFCINEYDNLEENYYNFEKIVFSLIK